MTQEETLRATNQPQQRLPHQDSESEDVVIDLELVDDTEFGELKHSLSLNLIIANYYIVFLYTCRHCHGVSRLYK